MIAGKRLVVVDDSIVRGNTTRQIVQMLRDAGAAEIHMRISAPPIKHPCHYGIDMSSREEMIAHERTTEQIAAELGCDTLHYLSLEGVYEAVEGTRSNHCDACFTGDYPLAGSDSAAGKYSLEQPAENPGTAAEARRRRSRRRHALPGRRRGAGRAVLGAERRPGTQRSRSGSRAAVASL